MSLIRLLSGILCVQIMKSQSKMTISYLFHCYQFLKIIQSTQINHHQLPGYQFFIDFSNHYCNNSFSLNMTIFLQLHHHSSSEVWSSDWSKIIDAEISMMVFRNSGTSTSSVILVGNSLKLQTLAPHRYIKLFSWCTIYK